jgi:GMP reductase
MKIRREYNYSDVYLVPRKTIVDSRSECDTSVQFGQFKFSLPIVAANMKSVVDVETCKYFARKNMFYVMHRFGVNPVEFVSEMMNEGLFSSISIGVNEDSYKQLRDLKDAALCPHYITLDIANAWSPKAEKMTKYIKDVFPLAFLIVGNMATGEAVQEIEKWGADCCKLFVGPGHACTTKVMTGFTRPTISCLLECVEAATKPVIADGGTQEPGDVAKAIACGATMVMIGSQFAGYSESAGEIIEIEGKRYKQYYGSASEHSKVVNKNHIEGKKVLVDYKGNMDDFIQTLTESLKSSISYAGGRELNSLLRCELVAIK